MSRLARVPPPSRANTTLGQILPPVPPAYLAAPLHGRINGIVIVTRLRQIIRRETLRAHQAR